MANTNTAERTYTTGLVGAYKNGALHRVLTSSKVWTGAICGSHLAEGTVKERTGPEMRTKFRLCRRCFGAALIEEICTVNCDNCGATITMRAAAGTDDDTCLKCQIGKADAATAARRAAASDSAPHSKAHGWDSREAPFCYCGQDTVTCQGCGQLACGDQITVRAAKNYHPSCGIVATATERLGSNPCEHGVPAGEACGACYTAKALATTTTCGNCQEQIAPGGDVGTPDRPRCKPCSASWAMQKERKVAAAEPRRSIAGEPRQAVALTVTQLQQVADALFTASKIWESEAARRAASALYDRFFTAAELLRMAQDSSHLDDTGRGLL